MVKAILVVFSFIVPFCSLFVFMIPFFTLENLIVECRFMRSLEPMVFFENGYEIDYVFEKDFFAISASILLYQGNTSIPDKEEIHICNVSPLQKTSVANCIFCVQISFLQKFNILKTVAIIVPLCLFFPKIFCNYVNSIDIKIVLVTLKWEAHHFVI